MGSSEITFGKLEPIPVTRPWLSGPAEPVYNCGVPTDHTWEALGNQPVLDALRALVTPQGDCPIHIGALECYRRAGHAGRLHVSMSGMTVWGAPFTISELREWAEEERECAEAVAALGQNLTRDLRPTQTPAPIGRAVTFGKGRYEIAEHPDVKLALERRSPAQTLPPIVNGYLCAGCNRTEDECDADPKPCEGCTCGVRAAWAEEAYLASRAKALNPPSASPCPCGAYELDIPATGVIHRQAPAQCQPNEHAQFRVVAPNAVPESKIHEAVARRVDAAIAKLLKFDVPGAADALLRALAAIDLSPAARADREAVMLAVRKLSLLLHPEPAAVASRAWGNRG